MKNYLIRAHNELVQVFVRGDDTHHMAIAIDILRKVIQQLEEEEQHSIEKLNLSENSHSLSVEG